MSDIKMITNNRTPPFIPSSNYEELSFGDKITMDDGSTLYRVKTTHMTHGSVRFVLPTLIAPFGVYDGEYGSSIDFSVTDDVEKQIMTIEGALKRLLTAYDCDFDTIKSMRPLLYHSPEKKDDDTKYPPRIRMKIKKFSRFTDSHGNAYEDTVPKGAMIRAMFLMSVWVSGDRKKVSITLTLSDARIVETERIKKVDYFKILDEAEDTSE